MTPKVCISIIHIIRKFNKKFRNQNQFNLENGLVALNGKNVCACEK